MSLTKAKNFLLGLPAEGKQETKRPVVTTSGVRRLAENPQESVTKQSEVTTETKPLPARPEETEETVTMKPSTKDSERKASIVPRPHIQTQYRWPKDDDEIKSMLFGLTHRDNQLFDLNDQFNDLQKERLELEKENADLNERLRVIQERSFRSREDALWRPMDESAISIEIESLQNDIEEFGRDYAADCLILPKGNQVGAIRDLRRELEDVWRLPGDIAEIDNEFRTLRRSVRLALTGLISSTIHREILSNPFFFVDEDLLLALESDTPHSDPPHRVSPTSLFQLYIIFQHVDLRKAHVWRSDFMRLLSPQPSDTDNGSESMRHASREARNAACLKIARSLLGGASAFLVKTLQMPVDPKLKELEGLCRKAASLASKLWAQRPALECIGLTGLSRLPYNKESTIMKAHKLHQIDDPNDRSLDGRRVQIVVHPAVQVRGTYDAEAYNTSRIWAKSVVWLDERNQAEK
ncbi:Hypothetical protein R9X50_00496000 [Acrodontium crateriforme]|uniref:Uncharacterized protein n=1 Tax=Acrodontium crateriforme TaxID=150365 RepID=A0AAQ3M737_9PEZI|nr:Hypothetical protein R9X50_00496000 [Acrodontium crateriforme]